MTAAEIRAFCRGRGVGILYFVALEEKTGILLGMPLSPRFVRCILEGGSTDDEYLRREQAVEALADELAGALVAAGFAAHSQSEAANLAAGRWETGYASPKIVTGLSAVSPKMLGRLCGLGFIGRNNLLVTREYGCALALAAVVTDAPLPTENTRPRPGGCGNCQACVNACPTGALLGGEWHIETGRAALLDIARCRCPLQCMMACPYTKKYAGIEDSFLI